MGTPKLHLWVEQSFLFNYLFTFKKEKKNEESLKPWNITITIVFGKISWHLDEGYIKVWQITV